MFRGITSAEHDYRAAAAALASSGLLQRSSRDEDDGSAGVKMNVKGRGIY